MSCCSSHKKHPSSQGGSCSRSGPACTTIERSMTIDEVLNQFPQKAQRIAQELNNAGLQCVGCHSAVWETLQDGMRKHGKTEQEIDQLVSRLNHLLSDKVDAQSIQITPRGAAKFLQILAEENKLGWALRFGEESSGCKGSQYVLDFSEHAEIDDVVFASHGVEIHVKKHLLSKLIGSEIDYVEGLKGAGFKISNPNVRSSCGCGNSHNYCC